MVTSSSKSSKPLPEENFRNLIYLYGCNEMYITLTKDKFDIDQPGAHAHDGYEFVIPLTSMPYMNIDGTTMYVEKGTILPVNPWQSHGAACEMKGIHFIDVMIDRNYFDEISFHTFGKRNPYLQNGVYKLGAETQYIIKKFMDEGKYVQPGSNLILESLCCQLSVGILREMCDEIVSDSQKCICIFNKRFKKVIDYMNENYNEDCSLEQLSGMADMSRYHFIRAFRNTTGKSPYDYLIDIRIEKAKELLRTKDMSITEIGTKCGFNNACNFSVIFRKRVGDTPSGYKDKIGF